MCRRMTNIDICMLIALSTHILIIISLTYKFPFYLDIWVATMSIFAVYASVVFAITPNESIRFSAWSSGGGERRGKKGFFY